MILSLAIAALFLSSAPTPFTGNFLPSTSKWSAPALIAFNLSASNLFPSFGSSLTSPSDAIPWSFGPDAVLTFKLANWLLSCCTEVTPLKYCLSISCASSGSLLITELGNNFFKSLIVSVDDFSNSLDTLATWAYAFAIAGSLIASLSPFIYAIKFLPFWPNEAIPPLSLAPILSNKPSFTACLIPSFILGASGSANGLTGSSESI